MELKKITKLPEDLTYKAIEEAVRHFVQDSHTKESGADEEGLYQQTLEIIANAIIYNTEARQFWIAYYEGEVMAYVIASVAKDVDNKHTYWITQAWVNKKVRGHKLVKIWYQMLREEAVRLGCKHIVVPSSRGVEAYLRFLGKGWHLYLSLLKEDLN